MSVKTSRRELPDTYFALVEAFPLTHIRDDARLAAAQALIDRLLEEDLDEGAEEYLDALTDLVEVYENQRHPIPDASEADVLRELMSSHGLTQQQLAREAGIAQSTLSAVLSGARSLTKGQLVTLARRFGVPAAVFLPA